MHRRFFYAFIVAAVSLSSFAQSDWKRLPDMPVEKWESGTVVFEEKLYLFGGIHRWSSIQ